MSAKHPNPNGAAGSFAAQDMINPVALAQKLQAGGHPFCRFLLEKFSPQGRDALKALLDDGANPDQLAAILAEEFNGIAAGGQSVCLAGKINGTKLRKSTRKLVKKNPQGAGLERMNTLLIQDFFSGDLAHDSCELVEVVKKKSIEFRIYKERRKLKTKWNESFNITFPAIDGQTSTHAPTLEQAHIEIETLVDRVLSGQAPVTKQENKERDAKAKAYDEIAAEVAQAGPKEPKDMLEFIKDAVKAQLRLGLERPLLQFVLYAVTVVAEPVKRCHLQPAVKAFVQFAQARKDVAKKGIKCLVATVIRVLVRGKAGAEVEFGNKLLLGENRQGIILDYQMWRESAPADAPLLVESVERVVVALKRKMGAVGGDRGFASKANTAGLAEAEIFDGFCPKSPAALKERMKEPRFAWMQKRRSQTEGRISILQRGFLGRPMRAKGFAHRELAVAWGVLTHNLWMLARLKREKKEPLRQAA